MQIWSNPTTGSEDNARKRSYFERTPTGSTPKPICPPPFSWGDIIIDMAWNSTPRDRSKRGSLEHPTETKLFHFYGIFNINEVKSANQTHLYTTEPPHKKSLIHPALLWTLINKNLLRFPTMWYMWPAKAQTSLCICAVWSEPLLVIWIFYDSLRLLTEHHLEFLSLKGGCIFTCQNATLLEITCGGSYNCVCYRISSSSGKCQLDILLQALPTYHRSR